MTDAAQQNAIDACDFWACMEYLNLVPVKEADERSIFDVRSEAELPWNHPKRRLHLAESDRDYKGQIAYCAPFTVRSFTYSLRELLGAGEIPLSELRKGDASCLLIPLDDSGRVCGDVFISSLPWLMGRVCEAIAETRKKPQRRPASSMLDLSDFDGFIDELMTEVRLKLIQLHLVPKDQSEDAVAVPSPAKQAGGANSKPAADAPAGLPPAARKPLQKSSAGPYFRGGKVCGDPEMRPLEASDVQTILDIIWTRCGWMPTRAASSSTVFEPLLLRIKVVSLHWNEPKFIDLEAMNSFVANDVMRVRGKLADQDGRGDYGAALAQYLKIEPTPRRFDIRDSDLNGGLGKFVEWLSPKYLPSGAWPDFPLVSGQQFAVNAMRAQLKGGGLYGVNGPPGTGKSTLLRDVIADKIVQRAECLREIDDPLSAFGSRASIEGYKYSGWTVPSALRRLGIVVASSNNGAVENIIRDLPKMTKPILGAGLSYFSAVSDSVAADSKAVLRDADATWGLVAALMGSGERRRAFMSRFWWEQQPKPTGGQVAQPPHPQRLRSLKGLIESKEHGALPWPDAVANFDEAWEAVRERAQLLQERVALSRKLSPMHSKLAVAEEDVANSRQDVNDFARQYQNLASAAYLAETMAKACGEAVKADEALKTAVLVLAQAQSVAANEPSLAAAKAAAQAAEQPLKDAREDKDDVAKKRPHWLFEIFGTKNSLAGRRNRRRGKLCSRPHAPRRIVATPSSSRSRLRF